MRQHLLPLFIAASFFALLTYAGCASFFPTILKQSIPGDSLLRPARHNDARIPPGLGKTIASREYHISYDRTRHVLQSPNRKHNLRAYYRPGNLTIQNRVDSSGHNFSLVLKNEGILADGRLIDQPDASAKPEMLQNRLVIRHEKFTEEFINNEDGVRQNFIVHEAPSGTKELKVKLVADGLSIQNVADNELLFFAKNDKANPRLIYRDLQCWDAQNRPLTAHLTADGQQIRINVDVHDAAYPVTIDPIVVNGSPANANALFASSQADALLGFSVASAGDVNADGYSDVLAGAPHYDNGEDNEGAAFLYYGSANGLNPVPTFLESNQAQAEMGYSVSSAGDINNDGFSDIALGAPFYDNGQPNEGVVFIHFGSPKGIKPNPATLLEVNQFGAQFGTAVALAGDINNDNYSDLVVGATEFDKGQLNEGAAFVYYGSKIGIDPNKMTILEKNQSISGMGTSVAGAGDVNADGFGDVLVGAPLYDLGEANEGAAFVYFGNVQGISLVPTIIQSDQADAHLGTSLASAGDLNGDGFSDIILGAPHYDKVYSDQGLVKIHLGSANGISTNSSTALAGQQMEEEFGRAVACAGDVEGDGYADIMIASRMQGKNLLNEGVVMLFSGIPVGINKKPTSVFKSGQANAYLGQSLAGAGDVDGDGYSDIVIGAHLFDHTQNNEGAVMIWHGGASAPNTATALNASQPESALGYSVSGAGDVDGDGYDDVIVGAPHYDNGQSEEGAAFLFRGTPDGIGQIPSHMLEANQADAGFGTSVSAAGDINGDGYGDIIVGAMHYHNGQNEEGAAFVYLGSPAGLHSIPIQLESNKTGAWFGCAVAHASDLNDDGFSDIVIGAMNYSNGQSEEGALYVFPGSPNGPNPAGLRIIESNLEDARLGNAVSPAGDLNGDGRDDIVSGAYSVGDYDAGAIFIGYGKANSLDSLTMDCIKGTQDQAHFGWDVSGAGDLNGDGLSDLIVGAHAYDNGDGAAQIYYGSPAGITQANVTHLYAHETGMGAAMGESVAGAGDLNGDGYSDIVVGSTGYLNGQNTTGSAFVYYGNNATGLKNNVRLFNSDLVTPINHSQFGQNNFIGTLSAKSFIGRNKGNVVWEAMGPGMPFSKIGNNPITTSTQFTGAPGGFIGMSGLTTLLGSPIAKTGISTKLRIRVHYAPELAITGQMYGPWRYLQSQLAGYNNVPVPEEAMVETIKRKTTEAHDSGLSVVTYPNPVSDRLFIQTKNADEIRSIRFLTSGGKLIFQSQNAVADVDVRNLGPGMYVLLVTMHDGTQSSHKVIVRK